MKKRFLMALLALSMASASLAGCGSGNPEESSVVSEQSSESVQESSEGSETKESEASVDSKAEEPSGASEVQEETPILKEAVLKNFGCRVGCAATEGEMNDPKVWEIITTHFNAITIGNELKPDAMVGYSVGRCPGTEEAELNGETIIVPRLDYSRAERMLNKLYNWNQEHPDDKIMVKGHVLLWHAQTPEWFFHVDYDKNKEYVDKDTMNKRLEWYIRTMLTHFTGPDSKYKDMFYGWDVVNEAIGGQPEIYRTDKENPNESLSEDRHGSNSSWWHVYQSNEFIINAFIYANKYAPAELELYYNDYGECDGKKITRIKQLLTAIKEREGEPGVGTRIDAMGMQAHYDMTEPGFNMFQYAIEQYSSIVGAVNISEWDIKATDSYDGSDEAKEEEYQKQYLRYKVLAMVMKNQIKEKGVNVSGITFWGTTDKYSWLQNTSNVGGGSTKKMRQCPLLFDENGEIKPAFYAFTEE